MKRNIKKVAVLGSGVMGSRIACHFAGVGLQVLLLDIAPQVAQTTAEKNKLVNDALTAAIKSNPSPVYTQDVVKKITTGNFEDNMKDIAGCDWIIEVVVERLDIKQQIYDQVEKYRKPGTLITSNTSGIPIHLMAEGRSEDFRRHFCGTHFFNPPRYLRLLEIIPTPSTDPEVVSFLMEYGDIILGKTTVLCKDTPAFIANRIGVYSIMAIFGLVDKLGLSIDEVDALTGPAIGRPKSATFRTADVVGIDTLVKVAKGVQDNCPDDEARDTFTIPAWLDKVVENKWLGDKTKQGFFKKMPPGPDGKKDIHVLNLSTLEYEPRQKPKFATVEAGKPIEDLAQRLKVLVAGTDKAGEFYRQFHYSLFSYISFRIPEISDELYRVDDAMMAGFGWEIGAFESWDVLGVKKTVDAMKAAGYAVAPWVGEMLDAGHQRFYKVENGKKLAYDPASKSYKALPGGESFLVLSNFQDKIVWKNNSCKLYDIGDGVLGIQWNTKMGSIGGDVLSGIQTGIEKAEKEFKGLVIGNEGPNFSAGANVGMIFMLAIEQEYDELDMAIRLFQNTMMRARYSSVPVVVAPHGLALGGACELSLHADKVCAAAETYTGLVELGVGLIPGGGGTKEFVLRAADEMHEDEPDTITLKNRFLTIATAKVATSAAEGFNIGVYRKGLDEVVMNQGRRIAEAKKSVIEIYDSGYVTPVQRKDVKVLGRSALGALLAGINGMWRANYATDHDALVARKLAYVMCGGDLSEPSFVSEQYLLDLEREAFLSLCGEKKTLERIQSVLKSGKPVRN
ncbi:MAG: 3-hydroxyacyl-CoA dehydrogenase [Sphingobacteriales bacterium SCN 48-20]|uniref:3-hydroxyacyl-CoA dehydrogenase NAD-binding domain-containing protein n=1 Tax=Terrimonas ferruginea TaxID=249 RepID=UPI00086E88F8|nr:3-hydroxyacyl-CoA dehydrogenase NAD-binding domain-containing protein [Terrimonas ferruginea]MBN8783337.1 3-hydroxyacyl-CoA dehydrogenase/enoyl-CoA hydratase family protein [Terrimonas ferruginea]ODT95171.1 MAG: 3-hydroxyacyl-CoA dehydrogenase [Sphingobacteriales bacterium SCN 48-20]OJW39953.1 MAG: 3-hydroxyacyl-CoA dehydrogenase [Sphingobacteriales bacterium 48-107]